MEEFRRGWTIVLTAGAGCALGVSGLLTYCSGLFLTDLGREIGLSRGKFGLGFFGATAAIALALPLVGRLTDRFSARNVALFGSIMLAAGFLLLGNLTSSVRVYLLLMVLTGLLASGSTPVAYTSAVCAAFDRKRGLALGLVQMCMGISAAAIPPLVLLVIGAYGWRSGYDLLVVLALIGLIPAALLPHRPARRSAAPVDDHAFARIARSPTFVLQLLAFSTMALGFTGFIQHFVPMLLDLGVSRTTAAGYVATLGMSVIGSRIVVGYLADRVHAPLLAAATCGLAIVGCLALLLGGADFAWLAALALGIAIGAEADLIGFLTARYFGIESYGRAYARQYAAFVLCAGISPAWIGYLADWSGGYDAALVVAVLLLGCAITLFLFLPRYASPREADQAFPNNEFEATRHLIGESNE